MSYSTFCNSTRRAWHFVKTWSICYWGVILTNKAVTFAWNFIWFHQCLRHRAVATPRCMGNAVGSLFNSPNVDFWWRKPVDFEFEYISENIQKIAVTLGFRRSSLMKNIQSIKSCENFPLKGQSDEISTLESDFWLEYPHWKFEKSSLMKNWSLKSHETFFYESVRLTK